MEVRGIVFVVFPTKKKIFSHCQHPRYSESGQPNVVPFRAESEALWWATGQKQTGGF